MSTFIFFSGLTKADDFSGTSKFGFDKNQRISQIKFFSKKKQPDFEQNLGRELYKALDDPDRLKRNAASALVYGSLDMVGLDDEVEALIDYVEENTEFAFGSCGELQLRNELRMETCLNNEAAIRIRSDYSMKDIQLEFNWRF